MRYHLSSRHNIETEKIKNDSAASSSKSHMDSAPSTSKPITDFGISAHLTPRESPGIVLARLCAVDRIPFNTIAKSKDILSGQKAKGIQLPQSGAGIRKAVLQFSDDIKVKIKTEIAEKISADGRFSISIDEYTSARNRRYMCLNLHDEESKVISLGMIRVEGTLPAEKAVDLTRAKLTEFGLSVESHILGVVSDGASVMKKFVLLLGTEHQICQSHGLHLAVCDILYKSQSTPEEDENGHNESKKVHSG